MKIDETEVSALLEATARAHHQAFIEADGDDPDWPLWYAPHSRQGLTALLGVDWTVSELVYHFVELDRRYRHVEQAQSWSRFYAAELRAAAEEQ